MYKVASLIYFNSCNILPFPHKRICTLLRKAADEKDPKTKKPKPLRTSNHIRRGEKKRKKEKKKGVVYRADQTVTFKRLAPINETVELMPVLYLPFTLFSPSLTLIKKDEIWFSCNWRKILKDKLDQINITKYNYINLS